MEAVTFEMAKKLKEKGYPQVKKNTLAMYDEDGEWYSLAATIDEEYCFEDFDKHDCVCPTISQVLKWLREEKDVVVSVNPYYGKLVNVHWWWDIRTPVYKVEICSNIKQEGFDSYELAALAGIEYVIDNLI